MRRSNSVIDKLFSEERQCSRTLRRPSFPPRACDLKALVFAAVSLFALATSRTTFGATGLRPAQNWYKKRAYQLMQIIQVTRRPSREFAEHQHRPGGTQQDLRRLRAMRKMKLLMESKRKLRHPTEPCKIPPYGLDTLRPQVHLVAISGALAS